MKKVIVFLALLVVGATSAAANSCIAIAHCANGDFVQFPCQATSPCSCRCIPGGQCAQAILTCPDGSSIGYACCDPTA